MKQVFATVIGLILIFSLTNCSKLAHDTKLLGNNPSSERECYPLDILIGSTTYRPHKLIGSGSYGQVYTISDPMGMVSEHHVIKIIPSKTAESARDEGLSEVRFAEAVNQGNPQPFGVKTSIERVYQITGSKSSKVRYTPLLIKERIHGYTLYEMFHHQLGEVTIAKNKFRAFRSAVLKQMVRLSEEGSFIADLHSKNIMFDGDNWRVIDGFLLPDKIEYLRYLDLSYYSDYESNISLRTAVRVLKDEGSWQGLDANIKEKIFAAIFDHETKNLGMRLINKMNH